MEEVAAGVHRIESDLGPRFMAQYLLAGEARSVLVDTGLAGTPDEVLAPALSRAGVAPDLILLSHADLDHSGGNARMRELYPGALFACHELDRRWIESNAAMLAENYRWHELYGLAELDEARTAGAAGDAGRRRPDRSRARRGRDDPARAGRAGGTCSTCPDTRIGHIGLWEPDARIAIIIDAALLDGIYDRAGNKLIPPRYYDAGAYRSTIRRIRALEPELLLTAHYGVMGAVGGTGIL